MSKPILAALAGLVLAAGIASAQPAAHPPARAQGEHHVDFPHQESDLRPDPNVHFGKLPNGMRYAILVNHTPTHAASVRLRFDIGSLMEDPDQQGLAHLIEHMAFNGSQNVPEGQMVQMLERHGLAFGADTNASTSFDETVYQLDAPTVDDDTIGTVFMLLRETAGRLTLAPDAVDRERGVVLSEERARNTPGYRELKSNWAYLYPTERFQTRFPIGTVDVLQHAPAQRVRDLYETYYRPERAFLVVVGDIDPAAIEARIRTTFGDWQAARPGHDDAPAGTVTAPHDPTGYFFDPGTTTSVTLSVSSPDANQPDTHEKNRRDMLRIIANNIVTRRFTTLSRQPNAHFDSGAAGYSSLFRTVDTAEVSVNSRPEDWKTALAIGDQELRRALRYGFSQAELDEQLAQLRTAFHTATQGAATRDNRYLAGAITRDFNSWEVTMAPADQEAFFNEIAPSLTLANVNAAFQEEWGRATPNVYLGTNVAVANAQAEIATTYAASRRIAVTPPTATVAQAAFAYTSFGAPGAVAETHVIDDLGITEVRFANNVRLNIKHTDFAHDAVQVSVRVGGGLLELPKNEPGLVSLLGATGLGGLRAHSADDLQHLLAGHNVRSGIGAGSDAFIYSGATTPEDLQLQLQVLAAYMTAPGYRPEGLAQFRQQIQASYQTVTATPQTVAATQVPRLLRSGDPRFGLAPEADLLARNYDELKTVLERANSGGAIEIGIVGDVDVNAAITMVASTFGALPVREATSPAFTDARVAQFPASTPHPVVLRHTGAANRALALIYWPAIDDFDTKKVRTLELLRSVLQLKLIDRVREQESATYSPSAGATFSRVSPGYGYLSVSLDLVPSDVDRFFGIVDQIVAQMGSGGISADELNRARLPILDEYPHRLEDNRYWMGLVQTAQTDPALLDRHRTTVADYQAITVADLRAAAALYLRPQRAYRVEILPPEGAAAPAAPAPAAPAPAH